MNSKLGWRGVDENGLPREVRVLRRNGDWRFESKLKGEDYWTRHEKPLLKDMEDLLDFLQRKYRRNRASFSEVEKVQRMVHEAKGQRAV